MKIHIDVDVTPEEARRFLGLPDLEPMQQAVLKDMQAQISKNMSRLNPEELVKSWFSLAPQGMEQVQKFFGAMTAGAPGGRKAKD
jgi:hypothetical protein